jgi:hypothetical protein
MACLMVFPPALLDCCKYGKNTTCHSDVGPNFEQIQKRNHGIPGHATFSQPARSSSSFDDPLLPVQEGASKLFRLRFKTAKDLRQTDSPEECPIHTSPPFRTPCQCRVWHTTLACQRALACPQWHHSQLLQDHRMQLRLSLPHAL